MTVYCYYRALTVIRVGKGDPGSRTVSGIFLLYQVEIPAGIVYSVFKERICDI